MIFKFITNPLGFLLYIHIEKVFSCEVRLNFEVIIFFVLPKTLKDV